jgi:hypothetical protein
MRFEFHPGVYTIRLTYDGWQAVYECFRESINPWSDDEAEALGCIEFWSRAVAKAQPSKPWEQVAFPLPDSWLRLLVLELASAPDTDGWGNGYDWIILNLYAQVAAQNRRKKR